MSTLCACTKERKNPSPPTAGTSEGFDKRLLAYAAVAGAGLLAAAPSAEAGVIYDPTTFTNNYPGASGFNIDLNGGGADFWFNTSTWSSGGSYHRSFWGTGFNNAQMLRPRADSFDAQFVPMSNNVVPPGPAVAGAWMSSAGLARAAGYWWSITTPYGSMSTWSSQGVGGQFANAREGYLGVRIPTGVPNSYNYGWIRFDITAGAWHPDLPIDVTVRGWAYETDPDTAIHAGDEGGVPEPGSLGLLAGGILGLAAWRRRKASQS